jgi:hypothetical protein
MKTARFRSNGKLMISGEYLVLAGAETLAIPLRFGQSLTVEREGDGGAGLEWLALQHGEEWFRAIFDTADFQVRETSDAQTASTMARLLREARTQNPAFLTEGSWKAITDLEFDRQWGLGSSSTLVSNLAWWASADPYKLLFNTLGGSGYDLACARSALPVIYRYRGPREQPLVAVAEFRPPFSGNLYFVYSGEKQSSAGSLKGFDPSAISAADVRKISELTRKLTTASDLLAFMELLSEHEAITGAAIRKTPVQKLLFPDFPGVVKSLGAWGGDFLLAASETGREELLAYFRSRGYGVMFGFNEMIK